MSEKRCKKCQIIKPISEFYTRGKGVKGYLLTTNCKVCLNETQRTKNAANPKGKPRTQIVFNEEKQVFEKDCSTCRIVKDLDCFYKIYAGTPRETIYTQCKTCANQSGKESRERIPDEVREVRKKVYAQNVLPTRRAYKTANKEKLIVSTRKYRIRNAEKLKAYQKQYQSQHPEKHTEREAKRRALKYQTTVKNIDRLAIIKRDNSTCYICLAFVPTHLIHLDHVVPLARGGTHTTDNLRVTCPPCNLRKGKKLLSEFVSHICLV